MLHTNSYLNQNCYFPIDTKRFFVAPLCGFLSPFSYYFNEESRDADIPAEDPFTDPSMAIMSGYRYTTSQSVGNYNIRVSIERLND
jgi:hypothetical protein